MIFRTVVFWMQCLGLVTETVIWGRVEGKSYFRKYSAIEMWAIYSGSSRHATWYSEKPLQFVQCMQNESCWPVVNSA